MYPNRTPLGLELQCAVITWCRQQRRYENSPLYVILFLSVHDTMHQFGISEKRNGQFAIQTTVNPASENLVNKVINNAMQKVIPRVFKEEVLHKTMSVAAYKAWRILTNSVDNTDASKKQYFIRSPTGISGAALEVDRCEF